MQRRFQNRGLGRVDQAHFQVCLCHLLGHTLRSFEEHLLRDAPCLRGINGHADGGENIEVVPLSRYEGFTVEMNWREGAAAGKDRPAL
jgi:hypothetical protein